MFTAARTGGVRFATTDEIEDDKLAISPERPKKKRVQKIPLADEALRVIDQAHILEGPNQLFLSSRGKPLSDG
jgi:integrase